jgi:hypothetical protein
LPQPRSSYRRRPSLCRGSYASYCSAAGSGSNVAPVSSPSTAIKPR